MMTTVETMAPAEPLTRILKLQEGIFQNALEGINDEQALLRLNEQVNHINWLLGHVTTCRYMLANAIGLKMEDPNGKLYFSAIGDLDYQPIESIEAGFKTISPALVAHIGNMTSEELLADLPNMPVAVLDIVNFYIYHEAYHLGQVAVLRKGLGLVPMKPN